MLNFLYLIYSRMYRWALFEAVARFAGLCGPEGWGLQYLVYPAQRCLCLGPADESHVPLILQRALGLRQDKDKDKVTAREWQHANKWREIAVWGMCGSVCRIIMHHYCSMDSAAELF